MSYFSPIYLIDRKHIESYGCTFLFSNLKQYNSHVFWQISHLFHLSETQKATVMHVLTYGTPAIINALECHTTYTYST